MQLLQSATALLPKGTCNTWEIVSKHAAKPRVAAPSFMHCLTRYRYFIHIDTFSELQNIPR